MLTRVYLYFSATDGKEGNISEILRKYRVEIHKARRALKLRTTTLEANSAIADNGSDEQRRNAPSSSVLKRTDSIPKEHVLRRMFKTIWKSRVETFALIATTVAMAYTAECVSFESPMSIEFIYMLAHLSDSLLKVWTICVHQEQLKTSNNQLRSHRGLWHTHNHP